MNSDNIENVDYKIVSQGSPIVGTARYRYKSDKCVVIELDSTSKYLEVNGSCGHMIFICATDGSLHLNEAVEKDQSTDVEFNLPDGDWILVCASSNRYTTTVTYLKDDRPKLQWCKDCGEGYLDFCRGKQTDCKMKPKFE